MKPFDSCIASLTVAIAIASSVSAQIVPDATLPDRSAIDIEADVTRITGGTTDGSNLFHSFREFSVLTGGTAYFDNSPEIQTIFSRVTGSAISNIDGLIRANGSASLFLLNPNGIIFGPNAQLDIGGSFVATTANSIQFANGREFSAINPSAQPLLTLNVPIGLQMGSNPGLIRVEGQIPPDGVADPVPSLQVLPGNTLALIGGEIQLDGAILQASGGRVELGGLAGEGTIALNRDRSLSFPTAVSPRANVSVTNGSQVNVMADNGGSIAIHAANLELLENSLLLAGIAPESQTPEAKAGAISIDVTDTVTLDASQIANNVNVAATGDGGDIIIQAGSLSLTNNASLDAGTFGRGNAGNIMVRVDGEVFAQNSTLFSDVASEEAVGNGGTIAITARSLSLTDGARLSTSTAGEGNAGQIQVNVTDTVYLSGVFSVFSPEDGSLQAIASSGFFTNTEAGSIGVGGDIQVTANQLQISDGAVLSARTRNEFAGGNIAIAVNTLDITGGGQILTESSSLGAAGNIAIAATGNVNIAGSDPSYFDRLNLLVAQFPEADASLLIDVDGSNSGIYANAKDSSAPGSGQIAIAAGSIAIADGAVLETNTAGAGIAGDITIDASNTIAIVNSRISSDAVADNSTTTPIEFATGLSGNISITGRNLVSIVGSSINSISNNDATETGFSVMRIESLEGSVELDRATLSTTNFGSELAGDIFIVARDEIAIANQSQISSDGKLGRLLIGIENLDISEDAPEIIPPKTVIIDGSNLTTNNAASNADSTQPIEAGSTIIGASDRISIRNGSRVEALTSRTGDAGNIIVATDNGEISLSNSQLLTDTTEQAEGSGGNIILATPKLSLSNQAVLSARTQNAFSGGNIMVETDILELTDGAQILTTALGSGTAGSIEIAANDRITLAGTAIEDPLIIIENILNEIGFNEEQIEATIETLLQNQLGNFLTSKVNLEVSREQAIAGFIQAGLTEAQAQTTFETLIDRIQVQTGLLAQSLSSSGTGSGTIQISTGTLEAIEGAFLETSTAGVGDAGSVIIDATDTVSFDGGNIFSTVGEGATGNGGTIAITARSLFLNNASFDAGTFGAGNAGDIFLAVDGPVLVTSSQIFSDVATPEATGEGGNIAIAAESLSLSDSAVLETSTSGSGNAGNAIVEVRDTVSITDGSRIRSSGDATGDAGNIQVSARSLFVDRGAIEAQTASGNGGNIAIEIRDLARLRQNGQITTSAGTAADAGDGGNIALDAAFLIASDDSDITANAFEGAGGFIEIDTRGIFGIEFRNRQTAKSDITAFSQQNPALSGEVQIKSPEIDTSALVDLPETVVDVEGLIARNPCAPETEGSSFVVTGRGGLPPNPAQPLNRAAIAVEWARREAETGTRGNTNTPLTDPQSRLIEATSWTVAADGKIILTAEAMTRTPHPPVLKAPSCQ